MIDRTTAGLAVLAKHELALTRETFDKVRASALERAVAATSPELAWRELATVKAIDEMMMVLRGKVDSQAMDIEAAQRRAST